MRKSRPIPEINARAIMAARDSICAPRDKSSPSAMHRMHKEFDETLQHRKVPSIITETADSAHFELSEVLRRMGELPSVSGVKALRRRHE